MSEPLFYPPRVFGGLYPSDTDYGRSRVVVLPVPYDSTTSYKAGARDGPQAIIDASGNMELFDIEMGRELHSVGIHTLPELQPAVNDPADMVERVYLATASLLKDGKMVVMLGGEHSLTPGAVRAYKEKHNDLSVLHLDAHADMREEYLGSMFSHACSARRVLDYCPLVQAGVRSLSIEEHRYIQEKGIKSYPLERYPITPELIEEIAEALSPNVYVSVDLDVLDPSIMSAVGTPEPGGLKWEEIISLLRGVAAKRRIVGFDIMELSPSLGPVACAYIAAKLTYKLIGYAIESECRQSP